MVPFWNWLNWSTSNEGFFFTSTLSVINSVLLFLQFKEFELYWSAVFSLRSVHTFSWFFEVKLEQWFWSRWNRKWSENGGWFCGVIFFRSNFKLSEKRVFEQNFCFLGSGLLFTCGKFTLIFTVFLFFWIGFFNWFSESIHSSFWTQFFVWNKFLLASGFLFTCCFFILIFCFFLVFWSDFFGNGFPNSPLVCFRSSLLYTQWKFFQLYVRTCMLCFFHFVVKIFVNEKIFVQKTFNIYRVKHHWKAWRTSVAIYLEFQSMMKLETALFFQKFDKNERFVKKSSNKINKNWWSFVFSLKYLLNRL